MRQLAAVLLLATAACSQRVYSPPSQLFAVTPLAALPENKQALDIDVSRHAQIFDPSLDAGAGRLRHGIGDNTEVSVEGTAAALRDSGPSPESRTFYTGRVGIRNNPRATGFTFFAGAGGGFADAGSFVSADAGLVVGIPNCTLVPTFQASAYISEPIDARPIDVSDDSDYPTFDTPQTTVGGVLRAGLRLSMSPSGCRRGEQVPWLVAGLGVTRMVDNDSDAAIPGVGIGIEIPLND
ncbi:MAG TPA: hypothetical protein VIV11_38610 [Kofleriaceae bacterium]